MAKNQYSLWVDAQTKTCDAGVMTKECLLVKTTEKQTEWTYFYDDIAGFTYEAGYTYELLISERTIENPPADASSKQYTLVKIIKKQKV